MAMAGSERKEKHMTKNQCKSKIAHLEGRIDRMQEQVIHYKRQVKVLDAEDSKKLLEKYHIESEELADLLRNRDRKAAAPQEAQPKKTAKPKVKPEEAAETTEPEQEIEEEQQPTEQHETEQPEPDQPEPDQPEAHTSMMDAFRKEAEQ